MSDKNVLLASASIAALVWIAMSKKDPFAVLEYSRTARANDIPNKIPPEYYANARGLLVVYTRIMSRPGAWTSSLYRSPTLNATIKPSGHPASHHTKARAIDFGGWTEDEILQDNVLGLGITNKKSYPFENPPRWHMSWASDYLRMLSDEN